MTFDDVMGIVVALFLGAYLVYGLLRRGDV
jgi:hypothetical protein